MTSLDKFVGTLSTRLARSVWPQHYDLTLSPDLNTGKFKGSVTITMQVKEPRNFIHLHSKDLNISSVSFHKECSDTPKIPVLKYFTIPEYEYVRVEFKREIDIGSYVLKLDYDGLMTGKIVGFYSTKTGNNVMAASKFQPTYARQAFPCFDEPAQKATYNITLIKPASHTALSNMNEISIEPNSTSGTEIVKFAQSVPMSTYLACFVICDYVYEEETVETGGVGSPFPLRAFARDTKKITFALDIGKRATEFYIQYYQIPFPLPKLDMIAIPDYVSGATEHWGLITYREQSFLLEPDAAAANRIAVANTVAHELAHMWFGNLVTMNWWDEVWLNEGFATYMQVKALNAIEPSWTMLDQFLTRTMHPVLVADSKLSSHPIVQNVTTPDQITAIFDLISYNKGSSILRMMEGFIGEENFQNGITDYLKKHMYGTTKTGDLLEALKPYFQRNNPNLELRNILDTWTQQSGYPLVTVSHGEASHSFTLTQTRYLADPDEQAMQDSPYNYRWYIPITYKTFRTKRNETVWFSNTSDSVTITLEEEDILIKVNNEQMGYYRVNYPTHMWKDFLVQLKNKNNRLSISDRAQLLDDVFALASSRHVPYVLALNIATYLPSETQFVPWSVANRVFDGLRGHLRDTPAYQHLQAFIQTLISPLYANMSWSSPPAGGLISQLLRTRVIDIACAASLPDAIDKATDMFQTWLRSRNTETPAVVEQDLRNTVYYYGMRAVTRAEWEALWSVYLREEDAQERTKLMQALAAPNDIALLTRYLEVAWDEGAVRSQDYLTVVGRVAASSAVGADLAWRHVRDTWPRLVDRFTLNSRYLGGLVPSVTDSFHTRQRLDEMEAFFGQYPDAGAGAAARANALETVRNNIAWSQHHAAAVSAWLESWSASSGQ